MAEISFDVSKADALTILAIGKRAMKDLAVVRRVDPFTVMEIDMDLTAVHANGCPLRLDALLAADASSFAHDVLGIRKHLDRSTGQLGDCFVPRYAA